MKKKKYLMLIAAITVSSAFLLNGCSFKFPDLSGQNTAISAETENLTDGSIQVYSRWYNTDNEKLAGAKIAFYDGNELLVEAVTDENGSLETYTLPGNTELKCVVTDASGTEIANSKFTYKISPDYSALTVFTTQEESDIQEIDVPADKTILSIAMYVTENNTISHANVTPYDEDAADETAQTPEEETDTSQDGQTDTSQDGQTDTSQDGQTDTSQDGQADQPQE